MKRTRHVALVVLLAFLTTEVAAAKKERPRKPRQSAPPAVTRAPKPGPVPSTVGTPERKQSEIDSGEKDEKKDTRARTLKPVKPGPPVERHMKRARGGRKIDLRTLPQIPPKKRLRPEREGPRNEATELPVSGAPVSSMLSTPPKPIRSLAAPAPILTFAGLDYSTWGAGHPPDTDGDVGPDHYIQAINTSIGIYRKSDGVQLAAFTFDTFMNQGNFGNICDTDNFGDPVVLYDTFEDRWIISDFAFQLDGGGNVVNPPGAYQCIAASITGDPVSGGWNFYSVETDGGLADYPKLGIWPDGLYMAANMFDYAAGGSYQNPRVYAFNKAQMYAGNDTVQILSFDAPDADFTLLPSNARLQTGTPPAGSPNYFVASWLYLNALTVYEFHVDWNSVSTSTFTGPFTTSTGSSWPSEAVANAPAQGGTALDTSGIRAMMQNHYANIGGVESLWFAHTVRRASGGSAAPRWYQLNVTGGTLAANTLQTATWDPDAANGMNRFTPSVAVDRDGNMAMGYSTSSSTTKPAIKYAGRLASDPVNTFSQTEQVLFQGTGAQTGVARWGDYSAMTLDPNGCTFWYTNEYYIADGFNYQTRVGSFQYPSCVPLTGEGTISGTVTATTGGAPIAGATVTLGSRVTTTNGSGVYSFTDLPVGTYPTISASHPGFVTSSATGIVVTASTTTTQNFSLATAVTNACFVDTTQADFETGTPDNVDLTSSPGNVILAAEAAVDQQNTTVTTSGFGMNATAWAGQTFTAAVSGQLVKVELDLFCSSCTGTTPNLNVSIRATTGSPAVPTGADLATAAITGFNTGSGGYYTATFGSPMNIVSGTRYAVIVRPASNPSAGTYAYVCSCASAATGAVNSNPYANGQRVTSSNSGGAWTADTTVGGRDLGFLVYVNAGFTPGTFVSSAKDSNPAAGLTPIWSPLTWNKTTPASTTLTLQIAGSNSATGPFNFVGPDGTSATFFTTSPISLGAFYDQRYLEYKAYLGTSNGLVTPSLHDVSVCYDNVDCSGPDPAIATAPAQVCGGSAGNTGNGPAGMTSYAWSIANGVITSGADSQTVTYTAGATGNVTLTLDVTQSNGCRKSNSLDVPITPAPATPTITPGGPTTFCEGGSVTLTSSSATSYQWFLDGTPIGGANQTLIVTASGDYTVVVSDGTCNSAPSAATTVTVNAIPATPTITPDGPTTFCTGASVLLTSSSASGNQWSLNGNPIGGATNQTLNVTASGNYTVTVTANGCASSASAATTVTVNAIPATPTITPDGPTTFCTGGSVTLTSSSASGNQWSLNGTPIGGATNQTLNVTASGDYTVIVTANGCASSASAATTVTVNAIPATPTITPDGPTTFCTGGSVTLTSSSASGNQWSLNGTPIGGATNQTLNVTASGNYTVMVTTNGCASSASAATTVTVNATPSMPTITPDGPTTFCSGGSVTLTSSSASGNQWSLNGNPIGGATNQTLNVTASGDYTVIVTANGCASSASAATTVTVNAIPATPTITPDGPTTFCTGGSVTLTSSSASGNQWSLNGTPIGGATNQTLNVTASGDYTVIVTANGCASSASAATTVTVNATPATPTITPDGPTTFCTGGSVLLTSSSASGNQWLLDGTPIGGATNQTLNVTASGDYSVIVTTNGCSSAASAETTVTVNAIPATPAITGANTFCSGSGTILTSNSAAGNQWLLNGTPIVGATNQMYNVVAAGSYTVQVTANGCASAASNAIAVTEVATPATPTITPGGPTTFCAGGSVLLTSSSASGNQWLLDGNPIGGATNQTLNVTASGNYTVTVTANGCTSAASSATTVTVNAIPATPTINVSGPLTFCIGGSVTLTSSSASGNQWYRNGVLLGGETAQTYFASTAGSYTVIVTTNGCTSATSAARTVVVNPKPDATITVPSPMLSGASATASVNVSCTGATFAWSIAGGTITSGNGTPAVTFTAGAAGTLTLEVTVTNAFGCTDTKQANVTVQLASFGAPPFIRATASGTNANVTWSSVDQAASYEIHRSTDNVTYTLRGTSATASFVDSGLTASTTYLYKVRAIKADTTASAFSAINAATTVVFTDDPITTCPVVGIKTLHISQLRTAVNLVRASVGLTAFSFTDPTLTTTTKIKAVHLTELRTALGAALTAISVTPTYTDPTITPFTTKVKAAHVNELRDLIR